MTNLLGKPEIDLFASRLNNQLNQYVSWHPDPGAAFIDAFNLNWHNIQFYAFPPFSLIARCLQKCITDEAEGILITPLWPTQFWFPQLLQLIQGNPVMFPQHKLVLQQPLHPQSPHPLWRSLKLVAWKISGRDFAKRGFQWRPQTSLWTPGVHLLKDNTPPTSTDGFSSVNVTRYKRCSQRKRRVANWFDNCCHCFVVKVYPINVTQAHWHHTMECRCSSFRTVLILEQLTKWYLSEYWSL